MLAKRVENEQKILNKVDKNHANAMDSEARKKDEREEIDEWFG